MQYRRLRPRTRAVIAATAMLSSATVSKAFTARGPPWGVPCLTQGQRSPPLTMIFAPPQSGYATPEEEESVFPDSYEPMMEYPGTMRPGRTPEDQPFHDLPIGDDDPDPVPWPHFQQIEWHHRWDPPHPAAVPMEEFIERQGRWATPEQEAAMRAGARRDVRERQEQEEAEKQSTFIMDDDEDDASDEPVELGDGIFGQLGSIAEEAVTAAAVAPPVETEEEEGEDDLDDFLLDLGLDAALDEVPATEEAVPAPGSGEAGVALDLGLLDDEDEEEDLGADLSLGLDDGSSEVTAATDLGEDEDVDFDEDEEETFGGDDGVTTVPLEDFGDDSGSLDEENVFDDGGFDYDDGDLDLDGGEDW